MYLLVDYGLEGKVEVAVGGGPVDLVGAGVEEVLRRYDRKQAFLYLDPPYFGIKSYRFNFEPGDFETLAQVLAGDKREGS